MNFNCEIEMPHGRKNEKYILSFHDFELVISSESAPSLHIHQTDILGTEEYISSGSCRKEARCLKVHFLERTFNKRVQSLSLLHRSELHIIFLSEDDYSVCEEKISSLIRGSRNENEKPYLIFVNPRGGKGNALRLFINDIEPLFKKFNVPYDLFITERRLHAEAIAREVTLSSYRALVACSGDGLVNELLNGLVHNPTFEESKTCIAVLPAGSGNAIAASVCFESGYTADKNILLHSAYLLSLPSEDYVKAKFNSTKSDFECSCVNKVDGLLFGMKDGEGKLKVRYGMHLVEWGLFADLDHGSERARCLGEKRFEIFAFYYIMKRRVYTAKIDFLPANASKNWSPVEQATTSVTSSPSESVNIYPYGTRPDNPNEKQPQWRYIPKRNEPLPDDWVTISGQFLSVFILNHTHISANALLFPNSHFDDGNLTLVILKANATRMDLIRLSFLMQNREELIPSSYLNIIKVKAVRVLPTSKHVSQNMLDGELVDKGYFQVEVIPNHFNILTGRKVDHNCN